MSSPLSSLQFSLPLPEDTDRLAAQLAHAIAHYQSDWQPLGLTLELNGDLGAGKTSFTRAMLRAWNFTGPVKSPTFSLVETYSVLGVTFNHFDFYRFETPEEFDEAGFRDLFGPEQICATEWSSKAQPYVPNADVRIMLTVDGLGRQATLQALTPIGHTLLNQLEK